MLNSNEDRREFTEMVAFLKKIGNKEGALDEYFRAERDADRILMPWTPEIEKSSADDFGLRLYCYRRSDNVVILFNGARKTQRDPEQCPNCRGYFNEAQLFSVAICSAFESGDLFIEKNLLLDVKEGVKLQTK